MDLAVILDPVGKQGENGSGVRQDGDAGIVALQRFNEGFRHTVRLRAADGREQQRQSEGPGGVGGVLGNVGAAVVRQPFDGLWHLGRAEAALEGGDHEVAHHLAGDAGLCHGRPGNDLAVAGIQDEENAHDFAVPGMDLQMV